MIIFDENVESYWIELFRNLGYDIFSIRQNHPGISDPEVLQIVKEKKGILITEDKDFGELVFSHGISEVSVLLMRYDQPLYELIEKHVIQCIEDYLSNKEASFITVSKNKVRIRKI